MRLTELQAVGVEAGEEVMLREPLPLTLGDRPEVREEFPDLEEL